MPTHARYVDDVIEAMSIRYNNRVYELREAGVDVIALSMGEAYFDIPLFRFDTLPFPDLYHYSHSRGTIGLRRKLSSYYGDQYDVPVDLETEIVVTAGAKIALHMTFMAILEPGDEVVVLEPAWVSYSQQVRLCHGRPTMVPCGVGLEELGEWITPRTRAIVVCSPQNPTGRVYAREELALLHALAREHDIWLVADESYSDFVTDEAYVSCGADDPEKRYTILCNSMSKNFGMSGWRVGYVIANPELILRILRVNQHLVTCPATILEMYLERHFDDVLRVTQPQIRDVVEKRARVGELMDQLGLEYMKGTATFYHFVSIAESALSSEEFCDRLLDERRVAVVAGRGYGESCDDYVRVSVGTEDIERIEQGLRALNGMIAATRRPKRQSRVVVAQPSGSAAGTHPGAGAAPAERDRIP